MRYLTTSHTTNDYPGLPVAFDTLETAVHFAITELSAAQLPGAYVTIDDRTFESAWTVTEATPPAPDLKPSDLMDAWPEYRTTHNISLAELARIAQASRDLPSAQYLWENSDIWQDPQEN